jgi:hypothetical protein
MRLNGKTKVRGRHSQHDHNLYLELWRAYRDEPYITTAARKVGISKGKATIMIKEGVALKDGRRLKPIEELYSEMSLRAVQITIDADAKSASVGYTGDWIDTIRDQLRIFRARQRQILGLPFEADADELRRVRVAEINTGLINLLPVYEMLAATACEEDDEQRDPVEILTQLFEGTLERFNVPDGEYDGDDPTIKPKYPRECIDYEDG